MQTIECKRVDLWDGGDRQNFGFYIHKDFPDDEIKRVKQHCHIEPVVITVFANLQEVEENSVRELRRSAWRKLSPQERVALGMLREP